ncbi:flagellar hook-associated protein FlgK [Alteromonas lipolytica]|uniref:Flagellar hook-associated protein 1 n=1 Tax=Alteromonas lipolytica TaxID=1856405 RepID=A0A1E8FF51_9ALTE|nr:flagellar hook-associated protein FlgK [Alteromonas lipolytica]OFI34565.1 flagellar hook-associated protein FlgK [Alteromonas lipolytica]GGF52137.1 flagellar hook protein FlgK [Alteromonas lipolytica]
MSSNIDLYSIATSGVNASSRLLSTTSNNIANVNSEGYVRERTVFINELTGGVGRASTERVVDKFAQNQMRRDITLVGEWETFSTKTSAIDNLLANEANSLATGLSDFFASVQTAADDPTNLASRDLVLSEGDALLRRMSSIADYMNYKEEELNLEFESMVNNANSLIGTIGDLNKAILVVSGNATGDQPTALLNERDNAINELAELMDITVRESSNASGSLLVNLASGESLVLEDGSFNLFELTDNADVMYKQLQLATNFEGNKNNTDIRITENDLGGALGGLFRYRDEILGPAQRDVGQLAVSFADAVNTQNKLGMDLDFQLGADIFTLPELAGMPYTGTPDTLMASGQFTPGKGREVTDADIRVTVTNVSAGVPTEVSVELLNGDGTPKLDENNLPVTFTGISLGAGYTEIPGGIEIDFQSAGGYSIGNEFLFQPVKYTASDITMATTRPEDLAFASPIRVNVGQNNLGDASVTSTRVTNTTVDNTLGAEASAFNGAGGIHNLAASPSPTVGAPVQIVFTSETSFDVLDGESPANVITSVTGVTNYENLLGQAEASGVPAWPSQFSALNDYPGYDFSLQGKPVAGDSFTIGYNSEGSFDNENALSLAGLQRESLVQLSTNANSKPRTLHESYSTLVSRIGEESASASIALQAAETMKVQSTEWFDSVSGVSLDEEAANLVRYQQSYAAAARILSTAQELFNTILSAVR